MSAPSSSEPSDEPTNMQIALTRHFEQYQPVMLYLSDGEIADGILAALYEAHKSHTGPYQGYGFFSYKPLQLFAPGIATFSTVADICREILIPRVTSLIAASVRAYYTGVGELLDPFSAGHVALRVNAALSGIAEAVRCGLEYQHSVLSGAFHLIPGKHCEIEPDHHNPRYAKDGDGRSVFSSHDCDPLPEALRKYVMTYRAQMTHMPVQSAVRHLSEFIASYALEPFASSSTRLEVSDTLGSDIGAINTHMGEKYATWLLGHTDQLQDAVRCIVPGSSKVVEAVEQLGKELTDSINSQADQYAQMFTRRIIRYHYMLPKYPPRTTHSH